MATKSEQIWSTLSGAAAYLLLALDSQISTLPPPFGGEINTFQELEDYLDSLDFQTDVRDMLDLTFDAFASAGSQFAAGHNLAAAVTVAKPTQEAVTEMMDSLEEINKAVEQDHRFHFTLALIEGMVKVGADLQENL